MQARKNLQYSAWKKLWWHGFEKIATLKIHGLVGCGENVKMTNETIKITEIVDGKDLRTCFIVCMWNFEVWMVR